MPVTIRRPTTTEPPRPKTRRILNTGRSTEEYKKKYSSPTYSTQALRTKHANAREKVWGDGTSTAVQGVLFLAAPHHGAAAVSLSLKEKLLHAAGDMKEGAGFAREVADIHRYGNKGSAIERVLGDRGEKPGYANVPVAMVEGFGRGVTAPVRSGINIAKMGWRGAESYGRAVRDVCGLYLTHEKDRLGFC